MTRPDTPFEAASYDLNKFRERRLTDRRFMLRDTPDRRQRSIDNNELEQPGLQNQKDASEGGDQTPNAGN